MATRYPLYLDSGNLKEMTAAQVDAIIDRAVYNYSLNPSVTLAVLSTDIGNLDEMVDTRYQAGVATSRIDRFATEAETTDISLITTTFKKINQSIVSPTGYPPDTARTFPVYKTSTDNIQAMTQADFNDTFIHPAIDKLVNASSNPRKDNGGTYFISTDLTLSAVPGYSRISDTPVFIDTIADAEAYTAAGIPEARDQPNASEEVSYYLYKYDGSSDTIEQPLFIRPASNNNDLKEYTLAEFDALLSTAIRYSAASDIGNSIRYSINGGGLNRGTGMVNTALSGTSAEGYNQRFVDINDYRTQEFPNGIPGTIQTYYLKIEKV